MERRRFIPLSGIQRIVLMLLVAFIGLDTLAPLTRAQRPQKMIDPYEIQDWENTTVDIEASLIEITRRAIDESGTQRVDLVFVIDGSLPMQKPVRLAERSLFDIVEMFEESQTDYRVAVLFFQNIAGRSRISKKPFAKGLGIIDNNFLFIMPGSKFKGHLAGYGLDAITVAFREMKFRWDTETHFILMTNQPLTTSLEDADGVIEEIVRRCEHDKVHINVIGISERLQIKLAQWTGGKWYRISKAPFLPPVIDIDIRDLLIPKIDEMFKWIAQHIADTVNVPIDLVFIYDSSLSMDDKVDAVCVGLDNLVEILDRYRLDYRFGVIRFWAQLGGGQSTILTTKPPLTTNQVKRLFRRPRQGDEHLLDAIVEGVPKLQTPADRKLVLFVVTDEFSSSARSKSYTAAKAIEVCRDAAIQVNVIGVPTLLPFRRIEQERFQNNITEATNGKRYTVPDTSLHRKDHLLK